MKTYRIRLASWVLILGLAFGCNTVKNANNKQKGAVIGASSGAVIGGVVGNNVGKGNTVLGAIIGGVVGGVAGGYIGDRMDRQAEKIEEELPGAEVKRVGEGINVTFTQDQGVHFATDQSAIEGASVTTLNKLAGIFKEYPKSVILVEGHTDSAGPEDYNMGLSQRRAESVVNYLVAQGIDEDRFTVRWYGETQPRADNSTAAGKAQNRRVEMGIIASEALKEEARRETGGN